MNTDASTRLAVTEIFCSIQGESTLAGLPCTFIRLSGCNLRCRYCDTSYAYPAGLRLCIAEVLDRVAAFGCRRVEVTGGEPLLQAESGALLDALAREGYRVLLETNGSILLPESRPYRVIMDIKCPSSGEDASVEWLNLDRLQPDDELKFVMSDRADFDWAVRQIRRRGIDPSSRALLFAPVWQVLAPRDLAEWLLDSKLDARLQLQLHRVIWPDRERGV